MYIFLVNRVHSFKQILKCSVTPKMKLGGALRSMPSIIVNELCALGPQVFLWVDLNSLICPSALLIFYMQKFCLEASFLLFCSSFLSYCQSFLHSSSCCILFRRKWGRKRISEPGPFQEGQGWKGALGMPSRLDNLSTTIRMTEANAQIFWLFSWLELQWILMWWDKVVGVRYLWYPFPHSEQMGKGSPAWIW